MNESSPFLATYLGNKKQINSSIPIKKRKLDDIEDINDIRPNKKYCSCIPDGMFKMYGDEPNKNPKKINRKRNIPPIQNNNNNDNTSNPNQTPPEPLPFFLFFNELNRLNGGSHINLDDEIIDDLSQPLNVCPGRYCDHHPESIDIRTIPEKYFNIPKGYKITLDDLIELGLCYHCQLQTKFNTVSLEQLAKLVPSLEKLRDMIGMENIKKDFVKQIVSIVQDFDRNKKDLLHTIIEGPPGVGKSHVVEILAEIYVKMGLVTKNIIKKVKRSDLIGKYLGHTAIKTQEAINSAMGGILLIDEAYSLGNEEKRDSFSKECIDTLNQNLTENSDKFICIIVGYEDQLDKCFFSVNYGLKSRFNHRYRLSEYNPSELEHIFDLKVKTDGWALDPLTDLKAKSDFFIQNKKLFKYHGRSMEILLKHTKTIHAYRMFFESDLNRRQVITLDDIEGGMELYLSHDPSLAQDPIPFSVRHLYL